MIARDTYPSYAQYNEDVILGTLLKGIKNGFYVDVGANHESYHSVTKVFYEKGWNGINIEPIPKLINELKKKRKRDINLNIAISNKKGSMLFREYPEHHGLSTLSEESKNEKTKTKLPYIDYKIKVERLEDVFKKNNVGEIDFIKIDVEGHELEVIKSNNWKIYHPKIICIEANHKSDNDWSTLIEGFGYKKFIFDGLNEYYVSKMHLELVDNFAEKAAIENNNALLNHHF